jgi:peptidoglycan hydrolase CwlO-like protein
VAARRFAGVGVSARTSEATLTVRMLRIRRIAFVLLLAAGVSGTVAASGRADLSGRYEAGQARSSQLRSRLHEESSRIEGFEGTIGSLQQRLNTIQRNVAVQEQLLSSVDDQLAAARTRLAQLRIRYAYDLRALATQLRADYETPPPTIVGVVVDSGGFGDLLNRVADLSAIERHNTETAQSVRDARDAVQIQTITLAAVQARRRRATAAVLVERDTVAQLKASIVARELVVERARSQDTSRLAALHLTLVHEAQILDQRAAQAQTLSSGGVGVPPPGGCANTPFVAHGGSYGFFQGPGTNYSFGEEPIIAARLDQLGRALQLHLVGISGYRTPQHSVEVGGFADDPHTHGLASDTPGVEGVPEATLLQFCLTRPFPGPREADHIQEG